MLSRLLALARELIFHTTLLDLEDTLLWTFHIFSQVLLDFKPESNLLRYSPQGR